MLIRRFTPTRGRSIVPFDRSLAKRVPRLLILGASLLVTLSCMPSDGVRREPQRRKQAIASREERFTPAASPDLGASPWRPPDAPRSGNSPVLHDVIARVVDGDTIVGRSAGRVRLIGINTPELSGHASIVRCFGREAAHRMEELLPEGTAIQLQLDVEHQDKYGRLLAYVYRETDGAFVNAMLVEQGYAMVATIPPNVAHVNQLLDLQTLARAKQRGLWSHCLVGDSVAPGMEVRR
jgi:micrococcal nuclease